MDCLVNRIRTRSKRGKANEQPISPVARSNRKRKGIPVAPIVTRQRRRLSSPADARTEPTPSGSGALRGRGRGRGRRLVHGAATMSKSQVADAANEKKGAKESPGSKRRRLADDDESSDTTTETGGGPPEDGEMGDRDSEAEVNPVASADANSTKTESEAVRTDAKSSLADPEATSSPDTKALHADSKFVKSEPGAPNPDPVPTNQREPPSAPTESAKSDSTLDHVTTESAKVAVKLDVAEDVPHGVDPATGSADVAGTVKETDESGGRTGGLPRTNIDSGESADKVDDSETPVDRLGQRDSAVEGDAAVVETTAVKSEQIGDDDDAATAGTNAVESGDKTDVVEDVTTPGVDSVSVVTGGSVDETTVTVPPDETAGVDEAEAGKGRERAASSCSRESDNQSWTPAGSRVHHPSADSDTRSTATTASMAAGGNEGERRKRGRVRSPSGSRSGSRSVSRAEQGPARHRSGMDFRIGNRLEARDCMNMWYASRVIQADWDKHEVLIHFERWNSRFDEWVSMDSPRLRAIARTSARKERKDFSLTDYKVGEIILAKWVDCKMYPAKVLGLKSDDTYNVVFYDGYKKAVQGINLRKLPPDRVGKVNFTFDVKHEAKAPGRPPGKKAEQRSGSTSSSVKTEGQASSPGAKEEEAAKPVATDRKSAETKGSVSTPAPAASGPTKTARTAPTTGEGSGRGSAAGTSGTSPASSKRKKLVVGGIFQAKRHHLAVKTGGNLNRTDADAGQTKNTTATHSREAQAAGMRRVTCNVQKLPQIKTAGPPPALPVIGPPVSGRTSTVESVILVAGESYVPAANGVLSPYHPPKEFMIEEDHNHYKCTVAGCNKSFRKEQLLASHAKHYHNTKAKKMAAQSPTASSAGSTPGVTDMSLPSASESVAATPQASPAVLPNVNSERKLITEKRRQLLFQRRIESLCKQYQQDQEGAHLASPKSKVAPRRQSVEPVTPAMSPLLARLGGGGSGSPSSVPPVAQLTPIDRPRNNRRHTHRVDRLRQRRAELCVRSDPESTISAVVNQPYQSEAENRIQNINRPIVPIFPATIAPAETPKKRRHRRVERPGMIPGKDDGKANSNWQAAYAGFLQNMRGVEKSGQDNRKIPSHLGGQGRGSASARQEAGLRFDMTDFEEREEMVNCICQQTEEDGLMMQCEVCLAWQHGVCFNIEQETQVPERYVCFACENPRGMRESFRYQHNQDWFKLGEMASFRFLPSRSQWPQQADMLRAHNVAGQLLSVKQVLHGLRCKLAIAKQPQNSNLLLWARPCIDEPPPTAETGAATEDAVSCKVESTEDASAGGAVYNFTDHSYSVNDQVVGAEEVVESGEAFVDGNGGGDSCPMEVAANEVLGGPDVPATVPGLPNGVGAPPSRAQPAPPAAGQSTDRAFAATAASPVGVGNRPSNLSPADRQKLRDRCAKKRTKKEVNVVECQLNLLDHIDQTQLALDRRMDDMEMMLAALESNCDGLPAVAHDGRGNNENLMSKRLLRAMAKDLAKVHQLSLFH